MDINLRTPPGFTVAELERMAEAVGCTVRPVFVGREKLIRYELRRNGLTNAERAALRRACHDPEEE